MKAYEFREMIGGILGLIIYLGLFAVLVVTSLTTTLGWFIPFLLLLALLVFYSNNDFELLVGVVLFTILLYSIILMCSIAVISELELTSKSTINEYQVKFIENEKLVYGDKLTVTDEPYLYWKCKAINCTKIIETTEIREPDFVHNNLLVFTKTKLDVN